MAERISRFLWSCIAGEDFRGVQQEVTQFRDELRDVKEELSRMRSWSSVFETLEREWQQRREVVTNEIRDLSAQIGEIDEQIKNLKVQLENCKIEEGELVPKLKEAEKELKRAKEELEGSAVSLRNSIGDEIGSDSLDDVLRYYTNGDVRFKSYASLFGIRDRFYRGAHLELFGKPDVRGFYDRNLYTDARISNIRALLGYERCLGCLPKCEQNVEEIRSSFLTRKKNLITRQIAELKKEVAPLMFRRDKLINKLASADDLVGSFNGAQGLRQLQLAESGQHGAGMPAPTVNQSVVTQVHVTTVSNDQVAASNGPAPGYSLVSTLSSCFCCHTAASLRNTDQHYEVLSDDPSDVPTPQYDASIPCKEQSTITAQPISK